MSKKYDSLVIGPVSLDHNIDYLGNERKELGGAPISASRVRALLEERNWAELQTLVPATTLAYLQEKFA